MNPFVFHAPTKILFGEALSPAIAEQIKEAGCSKIFLVTDAILIETGILEPILQVLQEEPSLDFVVFSEVPSDSDVSAVREGTKKAKSFGADAILSIGGGSVLDTAKVIDICLSFEGEILDYQGLNYLPSKLLPHFAIPTTSGTGSEVSMVAMVKDASEGKKLLFGSRYLAPDVALLDPSLLVSLPPRLTAATGLDAVTHAIEAFSAILSASALTDSLCLEALRLLFAYLPIASKTGTDLEARANTLVASTMAGMAFTNTGVGVVHALAHATGGQFGTHHGLTNSVFLTHGMNFNLDAIPDRYAQISRYLNFSQSVNDRAAAQALIEAVEKLCIELGLPRRLRDLGVPLLHTGGIKSLAEVASTDPAIMFNPKEPSIENIVEIYERAY
jgi:alcohol dehydrogenase class IV